MQVLEGRGCAVGGYTTAAGVRVRFEGWVRRVGDSLRFERRPAKRSLEALEGPDAFALASAEVRSLEVWTPDVATTAIGITLVSVVALTGWFLASLSRMDESAM